MNSFKKLSNRPSLIARVLKGGAWLGAGSVAEQGFRFLRNIILARLLAPEAFGLMAIIISVCSLFQVLTGLGIKESIVQNPRGAEKTYLYGAWWLAAGRGVLLYALVFVAAPWIASFYEAPELSQLLRIAFISVLAQGAMSAGAFVAVKQMRYAKWVFIQQGGGIIGILTAVTLAFYLRGVWALAIGYATEGAARCLLSYLFCPFKPGWKFDADNLRALLRFSRGIFGLPVLMLVYTSGTVFMVGKLCSKAELGVFAMVMSIAAIPTMFSSQLVDLLMPAFSEIQRDPPRVNQGILKITTLVALFGFPALFFIAVYGGDILTVLYGQRYSEGSLTLALLFANEVLCLCSVPIAATYLAVGQPALLRRFSLVRASVVVLLLWPAITYWKLPGAALVPLIAMSVAYGFQLGRLRRVTGLDVREYLNVWLRGLVAALPLAAFWILTVPFFRNTKPWLELLWVLGATTLIVLITAGLSFRKVAVRDYFWPFAGRAG